MFEAFNPVHILVIEDRIEDFILFKDKLHNANIPIQEIHHEFYLEKGLEALKQKEFDLIFLDLSLPDSFGVETIEKISKLAKHSSIIVLSGSTDSVLAIKTIKHGAQDYLIKDEFDEFVLSKTIRYSIERKKILRNVEENHDRYQSILKLTSDTIWDWDLRTNEFVWNEGLSTVFKYPQFRDNFHFDWFIEQINIKDRKRVLELIASKKEECEMHWEDEFHFTNANGEDVLVYARGYILMDEDDPYRMLCIMMDISERRKLQQELLNHQLKTQQLITKTVIETQESERKKLGLELHDNINQILATAKLWLDIVMNEDEFREDYLKKSFVNIDKAIEEIRKLSKSLVPPSLGDIGLEEALKELLSYVHSSVTSFHLEYNPDTINTLRNELNLVLYRIIQEQVQNILKHANASDAYIKIAIKGDMLELIVQDNGVGFCLKEKSNGLGLMSINSRVQMANGSFQIDTAPNEGCLMKIEIPITKS
ncbi:hybrid sensor histidine kinase/response regulator [Gynurincola endophyticus]|uniref:hybrid sensor histidine kinase/response regulator n=1 Tax=Gynurincola endophyticus TaxID=2479004 RepID=UPI000F8DE739|nr:response regulator [Gynurincola endophyticus]